MAATQRSDKDGAWCVDFRYRGRRIRRRSPVQTRRGAEQFERLLRAELLRREELHGVPFLGPPPTYARFADTWLEQRARPVNRPSTYEKKCIVVRRHLLPAFGALPIHGITEERIVAFVGSLRERKLKAKSIVNIQSILRSSLAAAYRSGYIRGVPSFPKIDVPEPSFSYLSTEDARKLVAATRPGYFRALVLFLLHTGCRFGEAAALRWEDVTLDPGSPRVRISRSAWRGEPAPTKNGRCRTIPLSPELRTELAAFRATTTSPFVFALGSGSLPGASETRPHLHRLCKAADIPQVSWHALRHTFATELSNRNVPIRVVQELLGHSSLAVTARYAHVGGESVRTAVGRLPALLEEHLPSREYDLVHSSPAECGH